jgi:hypothetical protein
MAMTSKAQAYPRVRSYPDIIAIRGSRPAALSNLTDQKQLELGRNLANPRQTKNDVMVGERPFANAVLL